jgi:hypothetical protein
VALLANQRLDRSKFSLVRRSRGSHGAETITIYTQVGRDFLAGPSQKPFDKSMFGANLRIGVREKTGPRASRPTGARSVSS